MKAERIEVAVVVEQLPQAAWKLRLENNDRVVAHPAPPSAANFLRLRPGDRVKVALSPHDPSRGRIVELVNKEL